MNKLLSTSLALGLLVSACGGGDMSSAASSTSAASSSTGAASVTSSSGAGGSSSASSGANTSSASSGGESGGLDVKTVLAELRADLQGTMQKESSDGGWPLATKEGYLFISLDPALTELAGDHDAWTPEAMTLDAGFAWIVESALPNDEHYKFTDGSSWQSDPWSRSYAFDQNGEISRALAPAPRFDRWFGVGDANMQPRTVRVLVPQETPTHVLYLADGQNLWDPSANYGGWQLDQSAPAAMLLVGIDNTPARFDEYTHVQDIVGGMTVGGAGDQYADFLKGTVRPLIASKYGEPSKVGLLGSSLGGLISFHAADRDPGDYVFAGSMSGTMGWGSIDPSMHNQTMIERYAAHGHRGVVLYLDSGGGGDTCADSDGDGIDDDDPTDQDNYCENVQMHDVLTSVGYTDQTDVFYWYEPGATHDEAHWAARVFRPLGVFAAL